MNRYLISSFAAILTVVTLSDAHKLGVQYMTAGISYKGGHSHNAVSIYCYRGIPKNILHLWQTVFVSVNLQPDQYTLFLGDTPETVFQKYEESKSSLGVRFLSWRSKRINLDPFSQTCLGIESSESYNIAVEIKRVDPWKVLLLATGICLFLAAPRLSSNVLFYYVCGITLGVTASLLIVFYFLGKLVQKKYAVYGSLLLAWTMGVYFLHVFWDNIKVFLVTFQKEVIGYMLVSGIISFIICYRFGPVTDPRTRNLIKWALQAVSLALLFYSSSYQEISVAFIISLLSYYNFPSSWTTSLMIFWRKKFPPKTKLLTEDEYHEQGIRETSKALEELRKYCSSPECKQWKTVLSLREPVRFAEFVEGQPHLANEEIREYEAELRKSEFLLDSNSDYSDEMDGDEF